MDNLTQEQIDDLLPNNLILLGYRGSISHNMYVPNTDPNSIDDIDLMGIFMYPVDHYIGINKSKDVDEKFVDKWDVVSYEFMKFVGLLLKSNPNVTSMLWLNKEHYIKVHSYGRLLIENRDLFVSKKAFDSYIGYAYGQLKKMESFVKQGYMGQKRKQLVEKYHYDTKNAAHCIRLLKMCVEFLNTGELCVFREKDADFLLDIKRGQWTLDEVKKEATRLFSLADKAFAESTLPEEPNYDKVNSLVMEIMFDYIVKGGLNEV